MPGTDSTFLGSPTGGKGTEASANPVFLADPTRERDRGNCIPRGISGQSAVVKIMRATSDSPVRWGGAIRKTDIHGLAEKFDSQVFWRAE